MSEREHRFDYVGQLAEMYVPSSAVLSGLSAEKKNGSIYLDSYSVKEYRGCWKHAVDTRDRRYDVYLVYTYPGSQDIMNIVRECARGCAISTLLVALLTGGTTATTAISTFTVCLEECVNRRVEESFSCDIRIDDMGATDWSGH
jgi:hypothetical protein